MPVFSLSNQFLTSGQFHSKSKILPFCHHFVWLLTFQNIGLVVISTKAKFLKGRCDESLYWNQNPDFLEKDGSEQPELRPAWLIVLQLSLGSGTKDAVLAEPWHSPACFPSPKFTCRGYTHCSGISPINAGYNNIPVARVPESPSCPLMNMSHGWRDRKIQAAVIDLCQFSGTWKTWSKFLIRLSRRKEKLLS